MKTVLDGLLMSLVVPFKRFGPHVLTFGVDLRPVRCFLMRLWGTFERCSRRSRQTWINSDCLSWNGFRMCSDLGSCGSHPVPFGAFLEHLRNVLSPFRAPSVQLRQSELEWVPHVLRGGVTLGVVWALFGGVSGVLGAPSRMFSRF